ncbi:MAG: PASTA domain-containing protein [Gemmatimonadetes bacterium]|nr:PASTA domain-containing protein [Gemmatimonadota bacterium]
MANVDARIKAIQAMLVVGGLAVLARAGYLQLYRGGEMRHLAESRRTVSRALPAQRGVIYDRGETALAQSLERYRIDVSAKQVKDLAALLRVYRADIGSRTEQLRSRLAAGRDFYAHGPFTAGQVRRLRALDGVTLTPVYRREYPSGPLARPLIGTPAGDSGTVASGLERFLDSILAGRPGEATLLRDRQGRTYESPGRILREPVPGHDVILTIDKELQEIAEGALAAVFRDATPDRGDIVFLDPRRGEVLAAASLERRPGGAVAASASYFQLAFEPGSTAKPFTAAALLELGRVDAEAAVSAENGSWKMPMPGGRFRTIEDDHPEEGRLTLARAVQVSSNIGLVKFATRLQPAEHYDFLRAFGFGAPTGVDFSGEGGGVLPALPHRWRAWEQTASVAMGYAFMVTPIQLAAAYGALANDGVLLAPAVVKEIRGKDGTVLYRHEPMVVRRVVSPETAATIRRYLALSASDSGTGRRAQVKGGVLGKTGTARLLDQETKRYVDRRAASFAGLYPAKDPQLVVTVRIENPKGDYYGGLVAAPLVARMLRQAIGARRTALDRAKIADDRVAAPSSGPSAGKPTPRRAVRVPLPIGAAPTRSAGPLEVPDVLGQGTRNAARVLHARGFRVRLDGAASGFVSATVPAAGESLVAGRTVVIVSRKDPAP